MGDLMDDDDDFGDLYAEVECQAISSINYISCIDNLHTEPPKKEEEKGEECNYDTNVEQVKDRADEENPRLLNSVYEKSSNSEDYMSDSEDDFNIVLNDEDCKGFSVAANGNGNRDCLEEDEDDNAFLCVKNGYGKNGLNPDANGYGNKYQVYESVGVASCSSQSVRGHWEDNRCKQHKVSNTGQLTNFQSSTNYAVSHGGYGFALPWYRTILDVNIDAFEEKRWMHPGVDISDFFNFGFDEDSWKQYCISLEQLRQQLYLNHRFPNHDFSLLPQACNIRPGSGKAPEGIVLAGTSSKFADAGEKFLELPKGRAIQVEDGTGERPSKMDVSRPRILDSDVVIQINVQDPDENCFGSCEEKLQHIDNNGIGSSIVSNLNVDDVRDVHDFDGSCADESLKDSRSSPVKGIALPVSESNEMNLSPDDPDTCHNVNAQTSKGTTEATETVDKVDHENGRTICKPDQHIADIEVSGGDRSHFSLTLSCSESESETSQDSVYNLPEASHRFFSRQSSGANLLESDAPDCKSPKRNDDLKKQDNRQHLSRYRSPNVSRATRQPGVKNAAFPMTRDNSRLRERQCDYGYNNRHNFSCDKGSKFYGRYGVEKFANIHTQDLYTKNSRFRYNQSFRNEAEPQQRRNWTEENSHERRIYDIDDVDEDWDCGERILSPSGTSPFNCGQSRRLFSEYNNIKESGIQWRRKRDRIEYGKQTNDEFFLLDHQNMDYDTPHKYGKPFLFNPEREAYLFERRERYGCSPPMNLDSLRSMDNEDEHWDLNRHDLPYWHNRETYAANKGRLRNKMSQGNDICDPGLDERYGQHRLELGSEEYRDYPWVENYNDYGNIEGDIVYSDDQAHRGWRKYSWKSRILHEVECESILRQRDNVSYVKRSSGSYRKSFRHEKFQFNHSPANGCTNRSRMFKGETNASFLNRKPLMTCRAQHVQTAWRYRNPVDLICGEGKSSGRRPTVASSMANRKLELVDQKFVKEQEVPKNSSGFQSTRAAQCSISKLGSGKDDKLLDKFPVTERNKDFGIEEGQIVPEGIQCDKGYDEQRILDTLAKMEKRRQRFQDPIALKKELDSTLKPHIDSIADTVEVENKQKRPARKRQWVGC